MMNNKERDKDSSNNELTNQHSLICNDELFIKDLVAIVDDTMRVDEEETKQ
jgi:hypothetical protein